MSGSEKDVYVCRECKYISAETVNGVCLRCHQPSDIVPLIEAQNLQNNYYRKLSEFTFDSDLPDPFPLRVLEHTAQISAEQAAKRERRFQDSFLPDEHVVQDGVDVLSVTTTMEMGIDIGDLTVVGLHNTPPTVANYQQRAGRAGRRSDGIAEVLTFSRHRSHDQYYYDRVADIVTGQVRIPTLHLNNHVIARRHVNALVLQRFFAEIRFGDDQTTLFEAFGTVGGLLDNNSQRLSQLRRFIENQSEFGIVPLLTGMLSGSEITQYDVEGWLEELPDEVEEVCRFAASEQLLLDLLIEKGLLPRYAFPVDVVALWINRPSRWNQGEEIQRDLSIALSEYAPGSEVIVDGKVYQSVGLYTPFEQVPNYEPSGWYYECPYCHYVQFASRETNPERPGWETCTMCQTLVATSPQYRVMPAIEPKGFRTDWRRLEQRKYRGGGQERAGYASPAQLVAGENVEQGELCYDERLYVYHRTGDLFIVNRGPIGQEFPGFLICPQCGCHVDNPNQQHNNPDTGKPCRGGTQADRSVLLHHFNTDIVLFGVRLPFGYLANPAQPGGRAAWLSLGTALRQGAAAYLQIDPEELAMGIRPWYENDANRLSAEIYLYDTLPNGAGYAVEVAQEVNGILETATRIVAQCPTPCETACYRCLLEYGNQPYHGLLDRHLAYDLLGYVISGAVPQLSPATGAAALDRLRAFARGFSYEVGGDTVCPIYGILQSPDYNRSVILIPTHTFRPHMPEYEEHARSEDYHPVFVSHFDLIRRPFWVWDRLTPILEGHLDRIDLL